MSVAHQHSSIMPFIRISTMQRQTLDPMVLLAAYQHIWCPLKPEIYIHHRVSLRNTYTTVGVRDQLNAKACITKRAILLSLAARTPKNTTQLQSPISQVLPITEKGNIYTSKTVGISWQVKWSPAIHFISNSNCLSFRSISWQVRTQFSFRIEIWFEGAGSGTHSLSLSLSLLLSPLSLSLHLSQPNAPF